MKTTLKDLLHAINVIGDSLDIFVDGIDSIAVCPPVKITPAGREYFKDALSAEVIVEYSNYSHEDTYVSESEEAWDLLTSLAGYCADSKFHKWFEGEEAELV